MTTPTEGVDESDGGAEPQGEPEDHKVTAVNNAAHKLHEEYNESVQRAGPQESGYVSDGVGQATAAEG